MQKWEYLNVMVSTFGINGQNMAVRSVNEQDVKDWKQTYLHTYINKLGADGWELTSTFFDGSDSTHLLFKRPKT